jgi:hypothetical protein
MSYIADLLAEVRAGCPVAAQELADFVEHVLERPQRTVAKAFGLGKRGGDARRDQRSLRDAMIRVSARRLPPEMDTEEKARVIAGDQELLRAVSETGLRIPKTRRLRDIIEIAIQYHD